MCGIVGLISKRQNGFFYKDLDNFRGLLVNDSQRGEDSTGAFCVSNNGMVDAIKVATIPHNLFLTEEWDTFQKKAISTGRMIIGHNRKATHGEVNSFNAHPFVVGDIVLIHNGTLNNWKDWKYQHTVDSQALTQLIAEKGHEEAISRVDGAFALVWYNRNTEKLYCIRNSQRPLNFVETADNIALASESWMAFGQFMRSNEKVESHGLLDEGVLYEFSLDKRGERKETKMELYKKIYTPPITSNRYTDPRKWARQVYGDGWEDDLDDGMGPNNIILPPATNKIALPWSHFRGGQTVQVYLEKIMTESSTAPQPYKAVGKVLEYGAPTGVDFVGYLPMGETVADHVDWLNNPITATVYEMSSSTCGPSIKGVNLAIDDTTKTHNGDVGSWTYKRIVDVGGCTKCDAKIMMEDNEFVSINLKSEARVHCPNCVENALQGEMKNEFIKRRNAAVQKRKSVSKESGNTTQSPILLQGAPTVH